MQPFRYNTYVTDGRTDRQTDEHRSTANIALSIAPRGKSQTEQNAILVKIYSYKL